MVVKSKDNKGIMKRVIIQGIKGSFHEEAAQLFFHEKDLEIVPALSFRELMYRFNFRSQFGICRHGD